MYGRDASGKILYGKSDLRRVASVEVESTDHSPIIGYAYDGNPIYGKIWICWANWWCC